jgi:hypothetical protein
MGNPTDLVTFGAAVEIAGFFAGILVGDQLGPLGVSRAPVC